MSTKGNMNEKGDDKGRRLSLTFKVTPDIKQVILRSRENSMTSPSGPYGSRSSSPEMHGKYSQEPEADDTSDDEDVGMDACAAMLAPTVKPKTQTLIKRDQDIIDIRELNDVNGVVEHCRELVKRWVLIVHNDVITDIERSTRLWSNFKVDLNDLQPEVLQHVYDQTTNDIQSHLIKIREFKHEIGLEASTEMEVMLYKALKICQSTFECLSAMIQQKIRTFSSDKPGNAILMSLTTSTLTTKQEMIVNLYRRLSSAGYRIRAKTLYEPIRTKQGLVTLAYRPLLSVYNFIAQNCNRSLNENNWLHVTGERKGAPATLIELSETIINIRDHELPECIKTRHLFSFENGVYLTRLERSTGLSLDTPQRPGEGSTEFYGRFIPYTHPDFRSISDNYVSAKYFNIPFVDHSRVKDWYHITTPILSHIIEYQFSDRDDCEEIARQIYIDIGRMLHKPGDLEDWQYALYIKGIAGTGKSTILDYIIKVFFETDNVAEINNEVQPQFGLGGLLWERDIFATVLTELAGDCQLKVTTLLNMISNGDVVAAVKHEKSALVGRWPSHMMFAGNDFPKLWIDLAGCVLRRFLFLEFRHLVLKEDVIADLSKRIYNEIPNIMEKCNRAYLETVNKHKSHAVKSFCPKYFHESTKALKEITNHLHAYMTNTSYVIVDSRLVTSEADLLADFKQRAKQQNFSATIVAKDMVIDAITQEMSHEYGVNIEFKMMPYFVYDGHPIYNAKFFFGFGLTSKMTEEQRFEYHKEREQQDIAQLNSLDTDQMEAMQAKATMALEEKIKAAILLDAAQHGDDGEDDEDIDIKTIYGKAPNKDKEEDN